METIEAHRTEDQSELTEEQQKLLDRAMKQISDRITIERLADRLPAIGQLQRINTELVRILHHAVVVFVQRNELKLIVDDEGRNLIGQPQDEALDEVNTMLNTMVQAVARFQ